MKLPESILRTPKSEGEKRGLGRVGILMKSLRKGTMPCCPLLPAIFHSQPQGIWESLREMQPQRDLGDGARTEKRALWTGDGKNRTVMTSQGNNRVGSN